jgi:predicted nucleotidyltransferase
VIGRDELARLREALDREGVAAAYVFGSEGRGSAGPASDVDVGIWASPGVDARRRFELRLELAGEAEKAVGRDVDVVVLDDAPPLLRHRAWQDGQLVIDRDPRTRVRGEARALVEYLDTKPLREQTAAGVSRRLAEGRFGRR